VTDEYEYDAYGNSFTKTGTTPNNYLYRGEQYDSDLALYYLRARYYNPATGRFLSRDPEDGKAKDPKTLHKYLYADGNPIDMIDPGGRGAGSYIAAILFTYSVVAVIYDVYMYGDCLHSIFQAYEDRFTGATTLPDAPPSLGSCIGVLLENVMWPWIGVKPPWDW
jgi:RHS repeat-associated protein